MFMEIERLFGRNQEPALKAPDVAVENKKVLPAWIEEGDYSDEGKALLSRAFDQLRDQLRKDSNLRWSDEEVNKEAGNSLKMARETAGTWLTEWKKEGRDYKEYRWRIEGTMALAFQHIGSLGVSKELAKAIVDKVILRGLKKGPEEQMG